MTKIKAILFDMDGVLIDAKEWHYEALNKALELFGFEINRYDHLVTFDGLPTKKKLEILSIEKGLPRLLHEFINELKQDFTMEIIYQKCKPIFFHQYALSKLKNEGYKICVCSNSIRNSIDVMMEKSSLKEYLEFFLSNQDVKEGKPNPEIYIKAIKMLNMNPDECLIVEDNENGVKAANASGAYVMRVNGVEDVTFHNIKAKIKDIEGVNNAKYSYSPSGSI
jgi:beta-phosphoglucomutase